ncbi:hypothetical protein [Streptomyces griseocarneus]|uniref:hypothetical protein n=1 Tax=Streptomyces griseocarneus TaxID=51201 RepID=UPI00167E36A9|nr:hypothetical protein [Streptomyces griseocarneus]MBZ6477193.1 hypothetical protein [Streptomyces griseocarneus]
MPLLIQLWAWTGRSRPDGEIIAYALLAALIFPRWLLYRASRRDVRREQRRRNAQARRLTMEAIRFHRAPRGTRRPDARPRFAVYLRPFDTTQRLISQPAEPSEGGGGVPVHQDLETLLHAALPRDLPLIAAGREGDIQIGAGRVVLRGSHWQGPVACLASSASLIVLIPSANAGTLWEMKWLRDHGALDRTVFIMPEFPITPVIRYSASPYLGHPLVSRYDGAAHYRDHAAEWDAAVRAAARIGLRLPPYRYDGALFTVDDAGGLRSLSPLGLIPTLRRARRVRAALHELGVVTGRTRPARRRSSHSGHSGEQPLEHRPSPRVRCRRAFERAIGPAVVVGFFAMASVPLPSPWHWVALGFAALALPFWLLAFCVSALTVPSLRIDEHGLRVDTLLRSEGPWSWPWASLSRVEVQSAPGTNGAALVLTAVPADGSAPAEGTHKRPFWHHDRYIIAALNMIGAEEKAVTAALDRYAGGRYRTPSARLPFRDEPPGPRDGGKERYEVSPDQPFPGEAEGWGLESDTWLRETRAARAGRCLCWLVSAAATLVGWYAWVSTTSGPLELLALPLLAFGLYALLKKSLPSLDGKRLRVSTSGLTFLATDSDVPVHLKWADLRSLRITAPPFGELVAIPAYRAHVPESGPSARLWSPDEGGYRIGLTGIPEDDLITALAAHSRIPVRFG